VEEEHAVDGAGQKDWDGVAVAGVGGSEAAAELIDEDQGLVGLN
jgi:hypothetical protein